MAFKSRKSGVHYVEFNHKEIVLQLDTFVQHNYGVDYYNIMRKVMAWINTPLQSRRTLIWKLSDTLELKEFNSDADAIPLTLQETFPDNCTYVPRVHLDMATSGLAYHDVFKHPDMVFPVDNFIVIKEDDVYYLNTSSIRLRLDNSQITEVDYEDISPLVLFDMNGYNQPVVYSNFQVGNASLLFFSGPLMNNLIGSYSPNRCDNVRYNDSLILDDEGNYLAELSGQTKHFVRDYLRDQIRTRYGFFPRPTSGLVNVVLDSYFPRYLYNNNFNLESIQINEAIPKTACAISPLVADCLNVKRIQTEQLCRVLGYDIPKIRALLTATKAKDFHLVFAGVGGTGMNTLYWLSELTAMANVPNLFNSIDIFESEAIEYSNMLRFPISLATYATAIGVQQAPKKMFLASPFAKKLVRTEVREHPEYLGNASRTIQQKHCTFAVNTDLKGNKTIRALARTVIYGAPNISSRDELSKIGNFIGATHANTSCSLWLNPKQDQDIQVESYGMIQLGGFFMNQLRLAIGLLEILASDQDLSEQDKSILRYEFSGSAVLKTDLTYNWQLVRELNMMTEEEANNQH